MMVIFIKIKKIYSNAQSKRERIAAVGLLFGERAFSRISKIGVGLGGRQEMRRPADVYPVRERR